MSGAAQTDLSHDVIKTRLNPDGSVITLEQLELGDSTKKLSAAAKALADPDYCGSCYGGDGPESGCCNTCDEVREAYVRKGWSFNDPDGIDQCVKEGWKEKVEKQSHEGCNVAGAVKVNKVIGNFHFAPGSSFSNNAMHVHDIVGFLTDTSKHDFTHHIHHFSFGPQPAKGTPEAVKMHNPLDGTNKVVDDGNYMFQYFLKVVSTQFHFFNRPPIFTNQYSVTSHERDLTGKHDNNVKGTNMQAHSHGGVPGLFFTYEISPMLVINREKRETLGHFLTGVCAIVGGVLTLAGIIDGMVYNTQKTLKRKMDMSKHL